MTSGAGSNTFVIGTAEGKHMVEKAGLLFYKAHLSRRVCCLFRMEGLDSKIWGLFLFLPVATAAAAAMPTGPERERERKIKFDCQKSVTEDDSNQYREHSVDCVWTLLCPLRFDRSWMFSLHGCWYSIFFFDLIFKKAEEKRKVRISGTVWYINDLKGKRQKGVIRSLTGGCILQWP